MEPITLTTLPVTTVPIWADAGRIHELIGVRPGTLRRLWLEGHVRRTKFGDSRQADTVYRVSDLMEYVEANIQPAKPPAL